ncbi:MAG: RHS repeat-associated core domain-containing protein [Bryobacterales bacterium]|nr:RHS repeat-associated core domain-containing protein [Bryobacterales bacterium]
MTDASKNVISRHDYLPYGWEIYTGITSRTTAQGYSANPATLATPTQRFTGKERDTVETGLDYFGARYFSPGQGRFTSADAPFADQQTEDPQSWNLYGYVRNRPLNSVDRDGRIAETLWDAFNIGIGLVSLVDNVSKGNYSDAAWDAGGVLLDTAATFVPFVPGGAGAVIKGARVANKIDNAVDTVSAARNADKAKDAAKAAGAGTDAKKAGTGTSPTGPVKAKDAPGVTAGGQATNKHGQKLGPSGRPQVNNVSSNTREAARNKANQLLELLKIEPRAMVSRTSGAERAPTRAG